MFKSSAKKPLGKNKSQYHLACRRGDLAPHLILTGDPARVLKISEKWDKRREVAFNREYRSLTGEYKGIKISCLSTGIGSPSLAIALEEAANLGVRTFIRVGSTGAIQKQINPGDLIINTAGVRLEGTSKNYIDASYPASAHYEVILALIEACEKFKFKYHLGIGASTDSFYLGEGRSGFQGYTQSKFKNCLSDWQKAKVLNFDMESSALFTLTNLYNLRAGAICAVFDNLVTDKWVVRGEKEAGLAASEALFILHQWDQIKKKKNKKYFYLSLVK